VPIGTVYQKSYFRAFGGPETPEIGLLRLPFDDLFSGPRVSLTEAVKNPPIEGFSLLWIIDFDPKIEVWNEVLRVREVAANFAASG
jgi:hypothetical protein